MKYASLILVSLVMMILFDFPLVQAQGTEYKDLTNRIIYLEKEVANLKSQNQSLNNEVAALKWMKESYEKRISKIEEMMGWASFRINDIWLQGKKGGRRAEYSPGEDIWLNVSWEAIQKDGVSLQLKMEVIGPGRVQSQFRDLGSLKQGTFQTQLVFQERAVGHYIGQVTLLAQNETRNAWFYFQLIDIGGMPGFVYVGKNEKGYAEYVHEQTDMPFILIPAGEFVMGGYQSFFTHNVYLDEYLISKYEVTQEVWEKIMGSNPSKFNGKKLPVEQITWEDAKRFCERTGLFMPTEAQWEKACRAGTSSVYSWGNTLDGKYVWYEGNSGNTTHPVGTTYPNPFGIYDMNGNVWEWCEDWYQDTVTFSQALRNPTGPAQGVGKVYRGGSWFNPESFCTSNFRAYYDPRYKSSNLGFRPTYMPRK